MRKIIECIPNFSEGRNPARIKEIVDAIESVPGIKLLNVSSGVSTNRTVVTFAGDPESVVEAAFRGIEKAAMIIDMRNHIGVHPRFGAIDVCPLVPVSDVTMEETVEYARKLAERVGTELSIPVYCYEHAAFTEDRQSLANCRIGGYEGLQKRLGTDFDKPDFGPASWSVSVAKTGAVTIGARNFLLAYNVNLNTTSTQLAQSIALDVRESGRIKKDPETGNIVLRADGKPEKIPGTLPKVRAIGWYIEEFGLSQVSMNLTDLSVTPLHIAFEEVSKKAAEKGLRVTGSELIGLVPLNSMLEAGRYFLHKQKRSTGIADDEIIRIAVKSLGLDDLHPFDPNTKIIEYLLAEDTERRLADRPVSKFVQLTANDTPGPGGGAVSAAVAAMGIALAGLAANNSAHKKGWQHKWEEFSDWAEKAKYFQQTLLRLADEDSSAFIQLYNALNMPERDEQMTLNKKKVLAEASKAAINIPFQIMQNAYSCFDVFNQMAQSANPNTISDTGVGACCAKAAVEGAFLTIKINALNCSDDTFMQDILQKAEQISELADEKFESIMQLTERKIQGLKKKSE